jgi:hypothetical protein
MEFFKQLKGDPVKVLKVAGVALIGLLLLVFAFQLLSSTLRPFMAGVGDSMGVSIAPTMGGMGGGYAYDSDASHDYAYTKSESAISPELSARNVAGSMPAPYPYPPTQSTGDDAEEYEVTQYSARIETRRLEESCGEVSALKAREDVIFENSNTYERGCEFTFKVAHESVAEVLALIEAMDPKDLSENTYTIKSQIEDFTSEEEVLLKKRASIDETLEKALDAYDDITRLATNTQNADALAKIIDSKVGIIERLTQERININAELDRLARAKAQQLDRLDYTYFYVSVYENKFVDGQGMKDSWKEAVREFVRQLNEIAQGLTINLLLLLFCIVQWALYALIALIVAKYGWQVAKYIWFR